MAKKLKRIAKATVVGTLVAATGGLVTPALGAVGGIFGFSSVLGIGRKKKSAPEPTATADTDVQEPPEVPTRGDTEQRESEQRARRRARSTSVTQGRASTVLTSSRGLGNLGRASNITTKTLLGA